MTSDQLSLFGLFLGLASLLGSLFAIHLSTWLRDLMALRMKAKKNHRGNDDASKQAMRECQYARDGLINSVPIVMTAVMTAFLGIGTSEQLQLSPHDLGVGMRRVPAGSDPARVGCAAPVRAA